MSCQCKLMQLQEALNRPTAQKEGFQSELPCTANSPGTHHPRTSGVIPPLHYQRQTADCYMIFGNFSSLTDRRTLLV